MDWIQVTSIIGAILAGIFYIHQDVIGLKEDIRRQTERTDRLYEMFIDLLKNKTTP